ncbi:Major facilitator superfamily domain, general substrate transporter [Penicillium italicum]|uniref:Major facilitator superfamily domain, general substrate transporter n=1 Tax=Penicillium italicum TaxID=40296 RepID=A0A0A2LCS2_PENIT|nr:Major facilitator superfamily domain, general substrate transporter [Penicillium italicum]
MTMGDLPNLKRESGGKRAPWLLKFRSSTGFIIGAVWMSTFTEFLLYAMIVPVMPTALVTRAGVEFEHREYWVSVLLMSEAGTSLLMCPIFGYLVDRGRTRRLPFISALVVLTGCMLVLQLAHSIAAFVAARVLQGIAGALVVVAAFALIGDAVDQEHLGQTIGYLGSAIASGFLLGPFLGGVVYNSGGYNAVFWFAYPILALDMVMRFVLIEKKVAAQWTGESNGELESDLETAQRIPSVGSREPHVVQRRKGFVIFRMLKQRRVLISSWALLAQGILLSAFDATLPIFVETTFGWNALGMGLIFLPMAVPAFFEPLFGGFTDRFGARFVAFGCFVSLSPVLICLRFVHTKSNEQIALLVSLLFLIGIFIHACAPAMYVETQRALTAMELKTPGILGPKGAVAQGFGLQSMCQFAGVFFGPLWGGFVEYRFGWGAMTGTLGVLVALTAIPMLWLGENEEERALMS